MPAAWSAAVAGNAPVIHGNITGPAEFVEYVSGIYNFPADAPAQLTIEKESRFIAVNGGGDNVEGMYHYISNNDGLGLEYNFRMYLYDAKTWIPKGNFSIPGNWNARDFSYDPTTGRIYGTFTNDDQTWSMGWMNPADGIFTPIAGANLGYPVVAVNSLGQVYAIDYSGNLLLVNKITGATTALGNTGLIPAGLQTGCIDTSTDMLYWCFRDKDNNTALYTVSISGDDHTAKLVGAFPQKEIVTGAYIVSPTPAPSIAPAAPTVALDLSGAEAVISGVLPSTSANGTPLAGKTLTYYITVDGIVVVNGRQAQAGSNFSHSLALSEGEHIVTVIADNEGVRGAHCTKIAVKGYDTPKPVAQLRAERQGNKLIATWIAPTEGIKGGMIHTDALSYEVKLTQGSKVTTSTVSDTRYEAIIDSSTPVNCTVTVTVVDGALRSTSEKSNPVMMGEGYALPYSANFTGGAGTDEYLILDANGDGATWYYEDFYDDMRTFYKTGNGDMDDWMFTPIVSLDTDSYYHLRFDAKTAGNSYTESFEVKAGKVREADGMTIDVVPARDIATTNALTLHGYFTVPQADCWHLGFHSITKGENFFLAVDNIRIERGGSVKAPAQATDVKWTAAADGALNCSMSITTPTTAVDGTPISGNLTVRVLRAGRRQKEVTGVTPGAPVDIEGIAGLQGANIYDVVCISDAGSGMPLPVDVYMGEDRPMPPTNVTVTHKDGNTIVSWDAPTEGANGGVINPANLTYTVRRCYDNIYLAEGTKSTSALYDNGFDYDKQGIMYYRVYATNGAGRSEEAESIHYLMGDPYKLPYYESFKDMMEMSGPWLGLLIDNPKGAWYIDSEGARPSCQPYDDNGGLVTFAPAEAGHTSTLTSPMVNIDDVEFPTVEFMVYAINDDDSRLTVSVNTAAGELKPLRSFLLSELPEGWNQIRIPLTEYKGDKYVQVSFTGEAGESYNNRINLDCIGFSNIHRQDVAAGTLETPEAMNTDADSYFIAHVTNVGVDEIKDVKVTLLRNGNAVAEDVVESIPTGRTFEVSLRDKANVAFDEFVDYSFRVDATDDTNHDNDLSLTHQVTVDLPFYPVPDAIGLYDANQATLQWSLDEVKGIHPTVREGFEDYDAFIIKEVGNWTLRDVDGASGTTGILDADGNPMDYPNMGAPMAYQVFNPMMLGFPTYDELGQRSMYATHSGQQMLCSFCDLDAYNDDWLISPQLTGKCQEISFFAKSYTTYYGLENFVVYTSRTGTAIGDFNQLSELEMAPGDWSRFVYTLPEGTKHFAIRCVSIDKFALCIDDVKYTPLSDNPVDLEVRGFNIYRDGDLAATVDAGQREYSLPVDAIHSEVRISALYDAGESALSAPIDFTVGGVDQIGDRAFAARAIRGGIVIDQQPDGEARIYSVDGVCRATVRGADTVALSAGVYIVNGGGTTVKLVVK